MPKSVTRRSLTFLVAVSGASVSDAVYAVMARGAEEALLRVRTQASSDGELAVVGALSSRMAKAIRLAAGEVRAI